MADGAERVALADAGQAEGQHIGRVREEVALGELVESTHQCRRQASLVERGERFPRRQLRGAAQAGHAALVSLLGLELQDFQEQRERRLLLGVDKPRDQLAGGRRQQKPREQRRDLIAHGAERGGAAHAAAPARSAS